jgi:phosphopantetheinyl transferase (holo-ACP synthase)
MSVDQTVAYVSRLVGDPISPEEPVALRSLQRAALSSWVRQNNISIRSGLINGSTPFSVRQLLGMDADSEPSVASAITPASAAIPAASGAAVGGMAIDIEEVANLPAAADYREHPFYVDNFTGAEIAHCVRQRNELASFCGLWAAKEAIVKAGLAPAPASGLSAIELAWDAAGRPLYPSGLISISHTDTVAVAVCLVQHAAPSSPQAPRGQKALTPAAMMIPADTQALPANRRASKVAAVVLLLVVGAIVGFVARNVF